MGGGRGLGSSAGLPLPLPRLGVRCRCRGSLPPGCVPARDLQLCPTLRARHVGPSATATVAFVAVFAHFTRVSPNVIATTHGFVERLLDATVIIGLETTVHHELELATGEGGTGGGDIIQDGKLVGGIVQTHHSIDRIIITSNGL